MQWRKKKKEEKNLPPSLLQLVQSQITVLLAKLRIAKYFYKEG